MPARTEEKKKDGGLFLLFGALLGGGLWLLTRKKAAPPPPPGVPHLTLVSVTFGPGPFLPGTVQNYQVTLKNDGEAPAHTGASSAITITPDADPPSQGVAAGATLQPGQEATWGGPFTISPSATQGQVNVWVLQVPYDGLLLEDAGNAFTVGAVAPPPPPPPPPPPGEPRIVLVSVVLDTTPRYPGTTHSFRVTLRNDGTVSAGNVMGAFNIIPDGGLVNLSFGNIAPGGAAVEATGSFRIPDTFTYLDQYYTLIVTATQGQLLSVPTTLFFSVEIPFVTLELMALSVSPGPLGFTPGSTHTLTVTLKNNGDGLASRVSMVAGITPDVGIVPFPSFDIPAGGQTQVSASFRISVTAAVGMVEYGGVRVNNYPLTDPLGLGSFSFVIVSATPTGQVTSVGFPYGASVYEGSILYVDVAWRATVRHWVALDLMAPPDYTVAVAGTSTVVLAPGTYSQRLNFAIPTAAPGTYRLRVTLVSESGQYLDTKYDPVQVLEPIPGP